MHNVHPSFTYTTTHDAPFEGQQWLFWPVMRYPALLNRLFSNRLSGVLTPVRIPVITDTA
jgi:hypothetical protein